MKRPLLGVLIVLVLAAGLAVLIWQWAGMRGGLRFAERFGPAATPTGAATAVVELAPTASASTAPTPTAASEPPASTPAGPLTASLEPGLGRDRVPVAGPLVVHFREPVNAGEVLRPLSFSPNLSGVFTWNDDHTAATFVPSAGFRPGATYRVIASANLRGVSGATFDGLPSWEITIAAAPRVVNRQPPLSTDDDRQPTFSLTFSTPMTRDSVTATARPAVPLDLGWDGEQFTIRPAVLLDPGVLYTFTVGEEATDDAGAPLDAPYVFRYTPDPVIRRVGGPTPTSPNAPLTVSFGYAMDPAAAEALVVEPALEGEWRWEDENTLALDEPQLLGNVEYAFNLSEDVRDAAGNPLPAPAAPVTFTAPMPVAISPAGTGAHPASVLRLEFTRPAAPEAVAAALTIAPETAGDVTWENENTLLFTPAGGYWEPWTEYKVTLDAAATDADGRPFLGAPLAHTFTTGAANSLADWGMGPQIQVLDADGRRAVQLQVEQSRSVALDFDLLPLTQEGFLNRLVGEVVSGWEQPVIIPDDGLSPIASWTTQTVPGDPEMWNNAQETLLPADAPLGLYLLRLAGEPLDANLLLALTRLTLMAKQSAGELVVWVTDIPQVAEDATEVAATNGAPIPGAAVQVYARNGRLLAEGLTDERGIVRLALPAGDLDDDEAAPYVVFARAGDDVTFSGLTSELQSHGPYYDWGWWPGAPASMAPPAFAVHIQTDRPLYRPGHTVHYKTIVRLEDDGAVILPPEGTQVIVRLRDARDNVVRTQWLPTDAFGAVYDSFDVAEGAMLGTYAIEAQPVMPGGGAAESHRQTFKVEEYRKPDYSVTVTPATPDIASGEPLTITVSAQYLFGEPVANAPVVVNLFELSEYYDWASKESTQAWYRIQDAAASGRTDDNGVAVLTVDLPFEPVDYSSWGYNPQTRRFAVEATVNDGSNLTVSASTAVTVHRAAELVELETESFFVDPGQPFPVTARVTTTIGEPTPVEGRALRAYLRHWSGSQGKYVEVEAAEEWITGPDGTARRDYTLPGPGYYQFRLLGQDDAGRTLIADTYVYALGEDESAGWWYNGPPSGITVSADREQYAPGDVARLAIASPFGGPALLTFERAAVRRELPVMLTPPLTIVEVPILPEDAPNIHVTVNAWEPLVVHPPTEKGEEGWYSYASDSQRDAQLVMASINLSVPVTDRTLTVIIAADREVYAPRDEATVTVRVTDAAGRPVAAQVALAMVDEAIFLLADDNTRPLHDAFYHERPNRVRTHNALAPGRVLYEGGMGGGGGDGLGNPRGDFPDTAAWFPALLTDANGEATVTIALADSLTTWRLTARAVSAADTSVGEAVHKFTTHQDVIVRPILPRGLTVGDTLALSAIIHNYGTEPAELTVTLSDEAGLLSIAEPAQTVALESGQTRVIGWPVEVAAAGETRALVVAAFTAGDTIGDAIELPLAARPLAVPIVAYASGDLVGAGEIAFEMPADALPRSAVTLEVSRSAAGSLLNGLEFLTGFPYGCVEQTMSRALPNAVVSRAFNTLGVAPPESANLDELVNASAQRLYGFQHDDGGWGWWFDDDSQDYQTAWVVFGLATMVEAGHEIDPGVIERGATYLREHLAGANPRTRAYMLYALAVAGQPDGPAALALLADADAQDGPGALDAFSLAALALALDAAGEGEAAGEIIDQLEATAIMADGRAHWGITGGDGYYDRKDMSSALRSTALALSAFVRLRPGSDLEPQIVRYLMDARRGDGWGTTNETAYAILGLTDHLLATGVTDTAVPYAVVLNGAPLARGELAAGELRDVIAVPFNRLATGGNTLEITTTGDGRLYYTLDERYAAPREAIEADGPIVVGRRYLSPDGKTALTSARAGELVLVRLTVKVPRDEFYMLVEDRVPGGLEPLNERLNATSHDGVRGPYEYWPQGETWRGYGYNYKEIREGRVTFFISELSVGTHTFEYTARATHTGTFAALPAEAWAMYELEAWGRSASDEIVIEE